MSRILDMKTPLHNDKAKPNRKLIKDKDKKGIFLIFIWINLFFLDQLSRLHMILKPFMLRRVKKDVENELSEKIEIKVMCEMSSRQKLFYQAVKNKIMFEDLLQSTTSNSEKSTSLLMNLVMQFRKVITINNLKGNSIIFDVLV